MPNSGNEGNLRSVKKGASKTAVTRKPNVWSSVFGWEGLFRWDVLGAIVPGVFVAVGLTMLGIDWFPHNLLIAQICFGIAACLLLTRISRQAMQSAGSRISRITFAVALSFVVLTFTIWPLRVIQLHKRLSPQVFFSVDTGGGVFSGSTDYGTMFWAVYNARNGVARAPISALAGFKITNLQNEAATVARLSIDIETENGWLRVGHIDSQEIRIFGASAGDKADKEYILPMLDTVLADRPLGPKESAKGWLAFCFPRVNPPVKVKGEYRFTITEADGQSHVIEASKPDPDHEIGEISVLPPAHELADLSNLPMRPFQWIEGYCNG